MTDHDQNKLYVLIPKASEFGKYFVHKQFQTRTFLADANKKIKPHYNKKKDAGGGLDLSYK